MARAAPRSRRDARRRNDPRRAPAWSVSVVFTPAARVACAEGRKPCTFLAPAPVIPGYRLGGKLGDRQTLYFLDSRASPGDVDLVWAWERTDASIPPAAVSVRAVLDSLLAIPVPLPPHGCGTRVACPTEAAPYVWDQGGHPISFTLPDDWSVRSAGRAGFTLCSGPCDERRGAAVFFRPFDTMAAAPSSNIDARRIGSGASEQARWLARRTATTTSVVRFEPPRPSCGNLCGDPWVRVDVPLASSGRVPEQLAPLCSLWHDAGGSCPLSGGGRAVFVFHYGPKGVILAVLWDNAATSAPDAVASARAFMQRLEPWDGL